LEVENSRGAAVLYHYGITMTYERGGMRAFIYTVVTQFLDVCVQVDRLLPRQAAL